jgi:hypothetical protein
MYQLDLIGLFESPKPLTPSKEVATKKRKSRSPKMGYDREVGQFAKVTEAKACESINSLNPNIKCVLHDAKGKRNFVQDIDVFNLEGKLIGHLEVQTTREVKFDKYHDWQFFGRRLKKVYDLPVLHVQQDSSGEILVLTPLEYQAYYRKNPQTKMRYARNGKAIGSELICSLPTSELSLFRKKNTAEQRSIHIYDFLARK